MNRRASSFITPVWAYSPCLKLKPVTKGKKSGFVMLNIEPYGGGLWHTWFDRDLSLAGRVLLRAADGSLQHRLVSCGLSCWGCYS